MKYLFIFLITLLACAEVKPIEEILMQGVYDYAELAQDTSGNSTTIYFDDGRVITITWPDETYCLFMQKGDFVVVVKVGTGSSLYTEIRIRRKSEKETP